MVATLDGKREVLTKTRETLANAQLGLNDLTGQDPTRKASGLHNVAVFGRSVTLVLQTMRKVDRERFDSWYAPFQKEMNSEPLFAYFRELRNTILKEGPPSPSTSVYVRSFSTNDLSRFPRPAGATGFFIGDQLGGSGWKVQLPDGTTAKYYVTMPEDMGIKTSWHLPDPPTEFRGSPLVEQSVEFLARVYLHYLSDLVHAAESEFGAS